MHDMLFGNPQRERIKAMKQALKSVTPILLLVFFLTVAFGIVATGQTKAPENARAPATPTQGKEHYVMRDGLRIYLWEKYKESEEESFLHTGKVAFLVHGGQRSGRSLYDLQIRDYSLMDFLAQNDYDVWAIDIHGYGHSDKTATDWIDSHSAAADIAAAVEYITKLRGVAKVNLLGCSAGTQRAGVFTMENPDKVAKLILDAGFWKGTDDFREFNRKRIENGGQPLPRYRASTEEDFSQRVHLGPVRRRRRPRKCEGGFADGPATTERIRGMGKATYPGSGSDYRTYHDHSRGERLRRERRRSLALLLTAQHT
jgi:pimeloyl-ACP methyl ester carboxylesterase